MVESLDVEGFGDHFQVDQTLDVTRVAFQNCGPQPQLRHSKKAYDGATAMNRGNTTFYWLQNMDSTLLSWKLRKNGVIVYVW